VKRCTPLAHPVTVAFAICLLGDGMRAAAVQAQLIAVPPFEVAMVPDVVASDVAIATDIGPETRDLCTGFAVDVPVPGKAAKLKLSPPHAVTTPEPARTHSH
jgi:hypothetical protein